ncbi:DNA polymerase catalytic subunit [Murid herpesvirus 3]|uniref:DNA polymerase n=2 Tax=Murid betaherpesvirus 3 TaxID=2560603 RepID=A0A1P8VIT4_9BETA|nr:DNA polymerase catalytic subunit [Murine roseolovirus]APZ76266.1 DNA polymerase catalytic subunit [Murid betaherpesvirus 3]AYH64711.1 DNA polymerase catalytic subunit [Murid herpesvirus 3]
MDNITFFNPYLQKKNKKPQKRSYMQVLPKGLLKTGESGCFVKNVSNEHKMFLSNKEYILNDLHAWPTRVNIQNKNVQFPMKIHVYEIIENTILINDAEQLSVRYKRHAFPSGSVLKLFGKCENGTDVCVNVFGQKQYFYCECDSIQKMNSILSNIIQTNVDMNMSSYYVEDVDKMNLYGFANSKIPNLKKICFANTHVAKRIGNQLHESGFKVYETDVDLLTRFLVDNEFYSFGWYMLHRFDTQAVKTSNIDLEINCEITDLEVLSDVHWPKYECLSFDIECISGDGGFPNAENVQDIVIQIGVIIFNTEDDKNEVHLFTVGSCLPIPDTFVYEFPCELDLLMGFLKFLKFYSPAIVTGYNINNFDIPYICTRMSKIYNIEIGGFTKLINGKFSIFSPTDKMKGSFISKNKIYISGMLIMDMYPVCNAKMSLPNYKLDTVAKVYLNQSKEDMPYKQIPIAFASGPEGRQKVGKYCIQDSVLVVDLFRKLMYHIEITEIARLAYVSVNRAIFDGQQKKIFPCILHEARLCNMIIPTVNRQTSKENTVNYKGATVLEPSIGFFSSPTVVLDFASLYPSIMLAHNLCYSTIILDKNIELPEEDVFKIKIEEKEYRFVRQNVRSSLLGKLLSTWLSERKKVKKQMQECTDEFLKIILDKKQLALKVTCNAVYGVTGTVNGILPCVEIAATVTALGRSMLCATVDYILAEMTSKEFFVSKFNLVEDDFLGIPEVNVVYGDTDSMFINYKNIKMDTLKRIGPLIGEHITEKLFINPIKLEFEKILCPLLLIRKKKYIGRVDGKLLMKGVELIRKTSCGFVKKVIKDVIETIFFDDEVTEAAMQLSRMSIQAVIRDGVPCGFFKIIDMLQSARDALFMNRVDVHDLILTNVLSREIGMYKQQNLPHIQVVKKLAQRKEEVPHVGDRVSYVLIAPLEDKNTPLFNLAEDPNYVITNNIPIHAEKYFDQIIKAVYNMISPIFPKNDMKKEKFLLSIIPHRVYIDSSFDDMKYVL